jgi:hypothetical protein
VPSGAYSEQKQIVVGRPATDRKTDTRQAKRRSGLSATWQARE